MRNFMWKIRLVCFQHIIFVFVFVRLILMHSTSNSHLLCYLFVGLSHIVCPAFNIEWRQAYFVDSSENINKNSIRGKKDMPTVGWTASTSSVTSCIPKFYDLAFETAERCIWTDVSNLYFYPEYKTTPPRPESYLVVATFKPAKLKKLMAWRKLAATSVTRVWSCTE